MFCPACGYENLPGSDYCQECLSSLYHLDLSRSPKTETRIEKAILKERVYQIYSPPSLSVGSANPVHSVLELMNANNKTAVVVKNDDSEIVGIFTERSFVRRVAKGYPANKKNPISDYMAKDPVVLRSTDKTVNALHLMFVAGYSYAIIDEQPPRILSIKDIIQYVIELYPSLGGFDKLVDELKKIALADGVISKEEAKILKKIEEKKEDFLRVYARIESAGKISIQETEKKLLEEIIDEFIPSVEKIATDDHMISSEEASLLRRLITYFDENKDRLFV